MNEAVLRRKGEVEDFLFEEAELMDGHRYDDWFALWAEELTYWVPCNEDAYNQARHVSLIFDDRDRLQERLFRLKSKLIHSQSPRSRLSRVIGNVRIRSDADDLLEVSSTFCVTQARLDTVTTWAGRQTHELVRAGASYKIRRKSVYLVNNDSVLSNLTFLI